MNTAITWLMVKEIEPFPGELLAWDVQAAIRFVVIGDAAIRLHLSCDEWFTEWGHYGGSAQAAAVEETSRFEGEGFRMLGPIHTAYTIVDQEGLINLSVHRTQVYLKALLPDDWTPVGGLL